jgi:hypothetical protein
MRNLPKRISAVVIATLLAAAGAVTLAVTSASAGPTWRQTSFTMVRSTTAVTARCLKGAVAKVTIRSLDQVEVMRVSAWHLPRNTDFDLFVIQVPNAPFGISWYQGDLDSNRWGHAEGTFVGRFSIETFAVAPGMAPAPQVHTGPPFPDAKSNPAFGPVHTYHLGLWFNSPRDAARNGCPNTTTPFNGDHTAGVQALSTRNFPDQFGPLRRVQP